MSSMQWALDELWLLFCVYFTKARHMTMPKGGRDIRRNTFLIFEILKIVFKILREKDPKRKSHRDGISGLISPLAFMWGWICGTLSRLILGWFNNKSTLILVWTIAWSLKADFGVPFLFQKHNPLPYNLLINLIFKRKDSLLRSLSQAIRPQSAHEQALNDLIIYNSCLPEVSE